MSAPVRYFHRARRTVEEEQIYGESALRWTYETGLGQVALAALVKRPAFSHWFGWRMNRPSSKALIAPFIRDYQLDEAEFADTADSFSSFNAFFYRKLKASARPIDSTPGVVVFPADGRHFCIPQLGSETRVFAKGQAFDLPKLLGNATLAKDFYGGSMVMSRLCPVDYHRFHFPCAGTPSAAMSLHGSLFSVSPIALSRRLAYLWENKRMLTILETSAFGRIAILEIGATCVGSIHQTFSPYQPVLAGSEKGYFSFGGSCVITVFQANRLRIDDDILAASSEGLESYAKMGERLGCVPTENS